MSLDDPASALSLEEQQRLLHVIKAIVNPTEGIEPGKPGDTSIVTVEDSSPDSSNAEIVQLALHKLWSCQSTAFVAAAESLADGCRMPAWRKLCGEAGILEFFLDIVTQPELESMILYHSLRLIGNSCADNDTNRQTLVRKNFTSVLVRLLQQGDMTYVLIPVLYNLCTSFVPAQEQVAANGLGPILINFLMPDKAKNEGLVNCALELLEYTTSDESALSSFQPTAISILGRFANAQHTSFDSFCSSIRVLCAILANEGFQILTIEQDLVPSVVDLLFAACGKDEREFGEDSDQIADADQACLALNKALSDISARDSFAVKYSLGSPLISRLSQWLNQDHVQMKICACVNLGNLARSDEICIKMVQEMSLHESLITLISKDEDTKVLHAGVSFLKNLSLPMSNKAELGKAGLLDALPRLWAIESVPQLQLSVVSLARQVVSNTLENVALLLSDDGAAEESLGVEGHLLQLLDLHDRTDSVPVKLEIARLVTATCRCFASSSHGPGGSDVLSLQDRVFACKKNVSRPLGTMVMQTEWPVVRSEGWFALALIARTEVGARLVMTTINAESSILKVMQEALAPVQASALMAASESDFKGGPSSAPSALPAGRKDRDNIAILISELLKNGQELQDSAQFRLSDLLQRSLEQDGTGPETL